MYETAKCFLFIFTPFLLGNFGHYTNRGGGGEVFIKKQKFNKMTIYYFFREQMMLMWS